MTGRRRMPFLLRGHPSLGTLSEYLDDELGLPERVRVERHLRQCERCRRGLESLAGTVRLLGELRGGADVGIADSVVAALRDERVSADQRRTALGGSSAQTFVHYCLARPQLRLALPVAVLVGAALSLTGQGAMLLHRELDVASCIGLNLLAPFISVSVILLLLRSRPVRRGRLRSHQR